MDYTNSTTARVTNFISFGDWVSPTRGDRKGQQAKVVSLYNLSSGQVARIEFQDGEQLECYASILVLCEQPPLLRNGKFALMRLWCPMEGCLGELEIGSDRYLYHVVDNGSPHVLKCFRLHKVTGKSDPDGHTVTILKSGQEDCTCGSKIFGKGIDEEQRCKHLRCVYALNLVDMPEEEQVEQLREGFDPFANEIARDDAEHQVWIAENEKRRATMVNRCVVAEPVCDEIPF
jgi:hypothetical protein